MFHANQVAPAHSSVATPALNPAPRTVRHVKNAVATTADTASAGKNVVSLVSPAMSSAFGNASIRDAPNRAASLAIVSVVINRVKSVFLASIPVLVYVGNDAQRSAESVTRTKSRRFSSEPKMTRMQGSWNWLTVTTFLKWI